MPARAWTSQDRGREGRTVTDACGSPAWTYGSEDQDREAGSQSGSQIAQPTSYDHGRARSTDCGSGREG